MRDHDKTTRTGTPARLPKSLLRRRLGHGEIGRIGRRIAANRLHAGSRNPDRPRRQSASQAAYCRWRKPHPTIRRERRAVCGAANRKQLGADCCGQFALKDCRRLEHGFQVAFWLFWAA